MLDYIRIACAVPPVRVGDVKKNTLDICARMEEAEEKGSDIVLFPELCLTGYTCGDLLFQDALLNAAITGLGEITACSKRFPALTAVVGLPMQLSGQLYNCAAVVCGGVVRGIVPKSYLPNYNEFYEHRWFASAEDLPLHQIQACQLKLEGAYAIPIGRDLLFTLGDGTCMGVEICEDLWSPMPPSTILSLNGAEVIVNLSASNELVGKREYRRDLVKHQSAICNSIYAFVSAGCTESTQDLVFSGHSMIAEAGKLLQENPVLLATDYLMVQDADLGKIRAKRKKSTSVRDAMSRYSAIQPVRIVPCCPSALRSDGSLYKVGKLPFVPEQKHKRQERAKEVFEIQVAGLAQRLRVIGSNAVIGISGGLDSTLALLVAVEAMRKLGRPASDVHGITMPCFGTSDRTYQNAWALMRALGVTCKEISIKDAVSLHFANIGHDPQVFNGTYENAQARERTQVLMDYAGMVNGIVIGTGDLSELALGWCTYNGDHMSMYGVNSSVPKTLIRWLIEALAEEPSFAAAKDVLLDILDTPVSPELLPPDEKGKITQYTEDLVGPYALHDFFLYYMLQYSYSPTKIYAMACRAFSQDFDKATIIKWLRSFYHRFFTQQFKRDCMPDGVKVGAVSLSPRGDWRMPSDASARVWLDEVDSL